MKNPGLLVRLTTIASSLLLVGGCISYRAGAFDWMKGNALAAQTAESPESNSTIGKQEPTFIPSTKRFLPDGFMSGLTPAGTFNPAEKADLSFTPKQP